MSFSNMPSFYYIFVIYHLPSSSKSSLLPYSSNFKFFFKKQTGIQKYVPKTKKIKHPHTSKKSAMPSFLTWVLGP